MVQYACAVEAFIFFIMLTPMNKEKAWPPSIHTGWREANRSYDARFEMREINNNNNNHWNPGID